MNSFSIVKIDIETYDFVTIQCSFFFLCVFKNQIHNEVSINVNAAQ